MTLVLLAKATTRNNIGFQVKVIGELERLRRITLEGDKYDLLLLREDYKGYVRRVMKAIENIRKVERFKKIAHLTLESKPRRATLEDFI